MKGYFNVLTIVTLLSLVFKYEGKRDLDRIQEKAQNIHAKHDIIKHSRNINDIIDILCMPRGSDRFVYRLQNKSHIYVGFDDVKRGMVYSIALEIIGDNKDGISQGFRKMPAVNIREILKLEHLLAATDEKIQKKFKAKITRCSHTTATSKTCVIQVLSNLARKMKEVDLGKTCEK